MPPIVRNTLSTAFDDVFVISPTEGLAAKNTAPMIAKTKATIFPKDMTSSWFTSFQIFI